jgi:nucleoside triphosphate pyrophosphatase
MSPLILASASPRRINLLQSAGFELEVIPASIDELHCSYFTPAELTLFNAFQKTVSVARRFPNRVIVGADTIVALGTQIFGKPRDIQDASRMLAGLVGKTHDVVTGVVLIHGESKQLVAEAVRTAVTFRDLSSPQIEEYLKIAEPLDKAGAYAAQYSPELIIQRTEGSFTNIMGLPMEFVQEALAGFGILPEKGKTVIR